MAAQSYNIKVKNTFLEVDVDDDSLSDVLSLDEAEIPRRQITEPMPSITRLLDIPKQKIIPEYASAHSTDYCETLEDLSLEGSTASSEHDLNQPDCELGSADYGNDMGRQVPELCRQQAADRCASKQTRTDSYAIADTRSSRRRKRESLIDIAARKNRQEFRQPRPQTKNLPQQRGRQPASCTQPGDGTLGHVAKSDWRSEPKLARGCIQCGVKTDDKFCRFCGTAIA
mmetsp:Transcript_58179/g.92483  ORF Transcript_58179/g.92483 Transcript_58179/m.92483 type:complete len:228 (+) Transcript_58179:54-737(+)|eukprot:CAMPEP_0169147128 /NCGR_PEP_ID=MMETSP1015-20121227/48024_1 /TAXON_ID=342587 /ORGANISM="Karlodinium micrum, Strain CCMP2283" /LENGTH=227 /DNA_ID=CAMNT_0009215253 /DNA_START=50 /DNA_END=733 /DNA_ORIENTATION=+